MKKIICGALALMSVFCMGACGGDKTSDCGLLYQAKYIHESDVRGEASQQRYYIFYKDGTARYHYYSTYEDYTFDRTVVYSYTLKLKYKIVEEENMVFCFYDGIEYDAADTTGGSIDRSAYSASLMYTEDFLMTTAGDIYMTASLIEELPNFGKK